LYGKDIATEKECTGKLYMAIFYTEVGIHLLLDNRITDSYFKM
jgi:hypothetical protein